MVVTLAGIAIDVKEEQPENALSPIFFTPSERVIEAKEEQPEKVS